MVSSSLISYSDEFFQRNSAIESYYDNKAQKINPGDLLLVRHLLLLWFPFMLHYICIFVYQYAADYPVLHRRQTIRSSCAPATSS